MLGSLATMWQSFSRLFRYDYRIGRRMSIFHIISVFPILRAAQQGPLFRSFPPAATLLSYPYFLNWQNYMALV